MAIQHKYSDKSSPLGTDRLTGYDSEDNNNTINYKLSELISNYIADAVANEKFTHGVTSGENTKVPYSSAVYNFVQNYATSSFLGVLSRTSPPSDPATNSWGFSEEGGGDYSAYDGISGNITGDIIILSYDKSSDEWSGIGIDIDLGDYLKKSAENDLDMNNYSIKDLSTSLSSDSDAVNVKNVLYAIKRLVRFYNENYNYIGTIDPNSPPETALNPAKQDTYIVIASGDYQGLENLEPGEIIYTDGSNWYMAENLDLDLEDLMAIINNIRDAAGLTNGYNYDPPESGYYLDKGENNIKEALGVLDTIIYLIKGELDNTQSGAGLGADGTYSAPFSTNYLSSATSIKNALGYLDQAIYNNLGSGSDYPKRHIKFPATIIKNTKMQNNIEDIDDDSDNDYITITSKSVAAGQVGLDFVPYIESLLSPTSGEEWALIDLDTWGGTAYNYDGDAANILKITNATRNANGSGVLTYQVVKGDIGNFVAGKPVAYLNVHVGDVEHLDGGGDYSEIIGPEYPTQISSCTVGDLSGGYVRMGAIVRQPNGGKYYIAVFTIQNDDSTHGVTLYESRTIAGGTGQGPVIDWQRAVTSGGTLADQYFSPSGEASGDQSWREDFIEITSILQLSKEDRYIGYATGLDLPSGIPSSPDADVNGAYIGYVKFGTDTEASDFDDSVEYAEISMPSLSANYVGYQNPSVKYWNGKYIMLCVERSNDFENYPTKLVQLDSDHAEGPFENKTTVYTCSPTTDSSDGKPDFFAGYHIDYPSIFEYNNKLLATVIGYSNYKYSGNKGNGAHGVIEYSETDDTWYFNDGVPELLNPLYGDDIWSYTNNIDYLDGMGNLVEYGDYVYYLYTAGKTTDSYQIFAKKYPKTSIEK